MLKIFVYRKISKNDSMYQITIMVMTKIVFVHDQKHVCGHYYLVGPDASPKSASECSIIWS